MISVPRTSNLLSSNASLAGVKVRLLVVAPVDLDPDGSRGKVGSRASVVVNVASLRGTSAAFVFVEGEDVAGCSRSEAEGDGEDG